ncbi:MAG TPA: hypothetical protein VFB72_18755, partial [Verrucomicrobiae bacterium]|nr:hypothetical protein [Verrucomicrobiae bacterium]
RAPTHTWQQHRLRCFRFCLASNHTGHENQRDNGYVIIQLPRGFTRHEAASFFADIITEQGGRRVEISDVMPLSHS